MAITAADIMTSPAITVAPEASLADIAQLLSTKHISAVLVCRADGALVGIVSEGDLLVPFGETKRAQRDWWLTRIAEGEQLSQEFLDYLRQDTRAASDVMARHIITAEETATVSQLAEMMTTRKIKRVPIVKDGKLVGVVSRSDLVAALAKAPGMLV